MEVGVGVGVEGGEEVVLGLVPVAAVAVKRVATVVPPLLPRPLCGECYRAHRDLSRIGDPPSLLTRYINPLIISFPLLSLQIH